MTDTHVIFTAEKVSQGVWRIKCDCSMGKIDYVTGFLDEQSTQDWLKTEHRAQLAQGTGISVVSGHPKGAQKGVRE
jgi:hypothetical protein